MSLIEPFMTRRTFVTMCAVILAAGMFSRLAAQPKEEKSSKGDSVKVVVEGILGTIVRSAQTDTVSATVVAGGGEFVMDVSASKTARDDVLRLANRYIREGSTTIVPPSLKVTGRLEFRATQVVAENGELNDGPKTWVLIADSVTEIKHPNN